MTKNKTLLVFFALVFGFCAFSEGVWDGPVRVCSEYDCNNLKEYLNMIYRVTNETYNSIDRKNEDIWYANQNIKRYVSNLDTDQSGLLAGLNYETGAIDTLTTQMGYSINYWNATSGGYGTEFREYIDHIDCSLCSDGQCIDLTAVTNILQQVTAINTNLLSLSSSITLSFANISNYLSILSVGVDNINTNLLDGFSALSSRLVDIQTDISSFDDYLINYLPYLETINSSLAYLATNNVVSLDPSVLSNFFSVAYWDTDNNFPTALRYHLKTTKGSLVNTSTESQFPYNYQGSLGFFNVGTLIAGGFSDLGRATHSLNNYWYWFMQKVLTNELNTAGITEGLDSLSNILLRVDSYVVGDFSNKFNEVVEMMNVIVTNQLDLLTNSNTNISALSALVETNNIYTVSNNLYLSSIDSKLDVLDYIKILSDTPFAEYSGDEDYFDYLTNLYLNGSVDSGVVTNWFERIEILLASLVFGDSDGTNGIPQGAVMEGFDSQIFENALTDYTFTDQFSSAVGNIETTSQNFMQILNGYHSAVKNVSKPASVSIGIFGMDTGSDTTTYEQLLDHSFQVSFDVGSVDRFTVVVRAVTTMCWVLLTLIFIWHCGFWICSKIQFFYRLMRLLINSIWLRS